MDNFFGNKNNSEILNFSSDNNLFATKSEQQAKPETKSENTLNNQYNNLKDNYEQIFIEAAESIRREINAFKPENPCANCSVKDCKIEKPDVFMAFPANCKYRDWQMQVLTFLSGDYRQKLKIIHKNMLDKRCEYSCAKCGDCCRLATSEYSYAQLKQRAMKGDKFSADFVSVFVPYENEEDAKKVNPEYYEMVNLLVEDEKIYYYYCPKMKDNLCTDYENRPEICKEFPHNPLKLLPKNCAFNEWKNDIAHEAMLLKAKVDIVNFYKERLG